MSTNMLRRKDDKTMTGKRLMTSLIQLIPLILVVAVIFGAVGGYINYFILEPVYTATTTFYVMAPMEDDGADGDEIAYITYYEKLALDYAEIAKSRTIVNEVAQNLGLESGLSGYEITVNPAESTRVMELNVKGNDAEMTKEIADETVRVFTDTVKRVTGAKNVNVIDYAFVKRTGPVRLRNTVLAAFAGGVLAVGLIVLKELADTTFRTADEIEEMLDLPVLAQVNKIKSTQAKSKGEKKSAKGSK